MGNTLLLSDAIQQYLTDLEINRKDTTVNRAKQILAEFAITTGNLPLNQIGRIHINSYLAERRKQAANGNRTLWNKSTRVLALLRHHGLALKIDKPRYSEGIPEVYEERELQTFFAACDERQYSYFSVLLMCGLRMQESKWLRWTDIRGGMIHVQAHLPEFEPKDHEARSLPLAPALERQLAALDRRPGPLVFPTKRGTADRHLWRHCKRIARRAGLDESGWSLHGFRRTFCTTLLRAGVDLRTVMRLMGHSDMESTLRYLRPLEGDSLRNQVGAAFAFCQKK